MYTCAGLSQSYMLFSGVWGDHGGRAAVVTPIKSFPPSGVRFSRWKGGRGDGSFLRKCRAFDHVKALYTFVIRLDKGGFPFILTQYLFTQERGNMKINYQETTSDLLTRIDIHNKYGGRDIDQWMLDLLNLTQGMKILDVGCGAGKQCYSYYRKLDGQADITGGDVNAELLAQARAENAKYNNAVKIIELDFNEKFPFEDNTYDLESCCFAIYYAENIPFTIREMHRVLKPGGTLFTTGPMPENKKLFYDIIREATGKPIPPMPGSSRYASEILTSVKNLFSKVDLHIFENPLTFEAVEPFLSYTRASLAEDRKLWTSLFQGKDDFEHVMDQIKEVSTRRLQQDGKLVMTKVVGGILATK
jgi:ubiquinone/menaquinone biosynthesis C-methylase UbiE